MVTSTRTYIHFLLLGLFLFAPGCSRPVFGSTATRSVERGQRWGIYALDLSSQVVELIYNSPDTITTLRLNHAGDRFAFSQASDENDQEGEEIFSLGVNGEGLRQLTDNRFRNLYPAWAPDDSQIAFLSFRDNGLDLYLMDPDGGNQRELYDSGGHDADIHWGTDKIVFTSKHSIWSIHADGSDPSQITHPPGAGEWGAANLPLEDYDPNLNPSGDTIVFERLVDNSIPHGGYDLFKIVSDGSGEQRLTYTGYSQGLPIWSHSGEQIVYLVAAVGDQGMFDIYLMNSDGTDNQNVTPDYFPPEFLCHSPIFSADDNIVYFVGEWYE